MAKTVLNVKTDVDVKEAAQKLAKEIGVPLSVIVNAQLKRFIADRRVEFSVTHLPALSLADILSRARSVLKKYSVTRAGIFGSYARGEARPDSDVDFLVVYGRPISLWDGVGLRDELSEALGRSVDIVSEETIIPSFRESIYRDLKPLYEG